MVRYLRGDGIEDRREGVTWSKQKKVSKEECVVKGRNNQPIAARELGQGSAHCYPRWCFAPHEIVPPREYAQFDTPPTLPSRHLD